METITYQSLNISEIQGDGLWSPVAGESVKTRGMITSVMRNGFYLQTPNKEWDGECSDAIFVFSPDWKPSRLAYVEVSGQVVDYVKGDNDKPVTQLHMESVDFLPSKSNEHQVSVVTMTAELIAGDNKTLAERLNSLEGMLIEIPAGQTFIAPSNPFGDYVLMLENKSEEDESLRSEQGGVLISKENPSRWFPGFRVSNYNHAQRVNVGAKLKTAVRGPLHYRVGSWQLAVKQGFEVEHSYISLTESQLMPVKGSLTVMTLNCFNLDANVEDESKVLNPRMDIDDDWGDGRFHSLARAIVLQAQCPDVVALQEIQDNDGAEQSNVTSADETYNALVKLVEELSKIRYDWVNIDPISGADGGQPGGNIRNGYLYNPERVEVIDGSVQVLARDDEAFIDSRKPLMAQFRERQSQQILACINVHLASKRHQNSIFAPEAPDVDAKLAVRIAQAEIVRLAAERLREEGVDFYITGDFNDTEHSQTMAQFEVENTCTNLVMQLPPHERYDYNHRGKLQVLMHGLVSPQLLADGRAEYEILHGNELIGVTPGEESDKPSDHAYVIARIKLGKP